MTVCLNHFVVFGIDHLQYIVDEFVQHYHTERPHQSLGNRPPVPNDEEAASILAFPQSEIACKERLGGLLKHYYRKAA